MRRDIRRRWRKLRLLFGMTKVNVSRSLLEDGVGCLWE